MQFWHQLTSKSVHGRSETTTFPSFSLFDVRDMKAKKTVVNFFFHVACLGLVGGAVNHVAVVRRGLVAWRVCFGL